MSELNNERIMQVAKNFQFEGELIEIKRWGNGHINDTFLLVYQIGKMGRLKVILQMMNKNVFPKPVELMENVMGVTSFLYKKIETAGGDPMRETLNVIPAKDGNPYYQDEQGEYWRAYVYISDARSFDVPESLDDFYAKSRIIVVPSKWYEGFPNVILRGFLFKRPVITTNIGAMQSIVETGNNGILVKPGDVKELSNAIQNLYPDIELCKKYGMNGCKKTESLYSREQIYHDLISVFEQAIINNKKNENI